MSMETKHGESGSKPFELILRVRSSVIELARQYLRALQNLPQSGDKQQLHKEWHVAVMSYWREISRFRYRDNISDTWNEEIPGVHTGGPQKKPHFTFGNLSTSTTNRSQARSC